MDGGPFRVPRPADRSNMGRPEPTRRQSEDPRQSAVEPKTIYRAPLPQRIVNEKKSLKRFVLPVAVGIVVIVLGVVGALAWSNMQNTGTPIDSSKYQAVFFTNGQVYFGKLQSVNTEHMKMTDIYYLQAQQSADTTKDSKNPQATSTDQSNVQLIKLGDEIHGPEDAMIINKSQVLFYENLKPDGKVAQSIEKYKKP